MLGKNLDLRVISTKDIGESVVGIDNIAISQNAEKTATSKEMSPSAVKFVLLDIVGRLIVELSTYC